ncbi:unnamed protein product, partial [Prorocentrum cordatum]
SPAHPTQRDQYVCRAARRAVGMPPLPRRQCIQRLNSHGRSEERRRTRTRRSSEVPMVQRLRAPQRRPRWPGGGRGGLPTALAAARKQASLDVPALGSGPPRRGWSIVGGRHVHNHAVGPRAE